MGATSNKQIEYGEKTKRRAIVSLLIVALLFLSFLSYIYWTRFQEILTLQGKIEDLKGKIARLKEDNRSLEAKLTRRNDLSYIKKLAQERLGLQLPKEKVKEEDGGENGP